MRLTMWIGRCWSLRVELSQVRGKSLLNTFGIKWNDRESVFNKVVVLLYTKMCLTKSRSLLFPQASNSNHEVRFFFLEDLPPVLLLPSSTPPNNHPTPLQAPSPFFILKLSYYEALTKGFIFKSESLIHLPGRALLRVDKFLIPRPPFFFSM